MGLQIQNGGKKMRKEEFATLKIIFASQGLGQLQIKDLYLLEVNGEF